MKHSTLTIFKYMWSESQCKFRGKTQTPYSVSFRKKIIKLVFFVSFAVFRFVSTTKNLVSNNPTLVADAKVVFFLVGTSRCSGRRCADWNWGPSPWFSFRFTGSLILRHRVFTVGKYITQLFRHECNVRGDFGIQIGVVLAAKSGRDLRAALQH